MAPLTLLWGESPERLALGPNDLHVWAVDLDAPERDVAFLAATLSADERERAARFHFERDQRRYVVRRGLLRAILARYLDIPGAEVSFGYGHQGKPFLSTGVPAPRLRFNLSDCEALAVYAVTSDREVGIDVERVRVLPDAGDVAERFFSVAEREELRRVPADQHPTAFFNCWTRKESYIKAVGDGLSHPLDSFDVSLAKGAPAALLRIGDTPDAAARWTIEALQPAFGYVGALASEAVALEVRCWRWPMT